AMAVRLHAPAASPLGRWNDFLTIGSTDDFPLCGSVECPSAPVRTPSSATSLRNGLAATYGLAKALYGRSLWEGLRSYDHARMALLAADILCRRPASPYSFFAGCVSVGAAAIIAM